jgi:predicted PhzF superfamily epimerase YddE/YHI9
MAGMMKIIKNGLEKNNWSYMEKIYETCVVFAFSGENAHGNPALVVFAEDISEEDKIKITEQARVSINGEEPTTLPIIAFIKENDVANKIFDIDYWFPGRKINICGHGTVASLRAIIEKYNMDDGKENTYTFNLNKDFPENNKFPQLKIKSDGVHFFLELNDIEYPKLLLKDEPAYQLIKEELKDNLLDGNIYFTDLHDYVCVCKDVKLLRETIIPKEKLFNLRKIDSERNYRAFITVAKSDFEGYDYETTVFCDQLPPPVFKDPACGSANKEIPQLLKISNVFPDKFSTDVANFKMFYPYRFADKTAKKQMMGGIQNVEYRHKEGVIIVSSNTSEGEWGKCTINNDECVFE